MIVRGSHVWKAAIVVLLLLQGHIAAASPTFGHSLPSVFPEPTKFNPDRFKQDPNVKVGIYFLYAIQQGLPIPMSHIVPSYLPIKALYDCISHETNMVSACCAITTALIVIFELMFSSGHLTKPSLVACIWDN